MSSLPQLPLHAGAKVGGIPRYLRHTWDHEWLVVDEGNATVGITASAAQALGDVVHLRLPEVGTRVEAGERCGEIASPTAAGGPYAPASGRVADKHPLYPGL
jgi:glycine cleavage system H protein